MFSRVLALLALASCSATFVAGAERSLTIDRAESHIDVVVKATMDSFVGRLAEYEPAVIVGDDGQVARARLAFHFRDVLTGKPKRDTQMHEWQHTSEFPDGEFVLVRIERGERESAAVGRLSFHGVTRELRFPVTIQHEGGLYTIDGDASVDTREFGLPVIRMLGVLKVDPVVHVKFHLQGRLPRA